MSAATRDARRQPEGRSKWQSCASASSAKFGIEAHEAPATEFPAQPSQKDGLGRMCKPHWNAYTNALRKAALARKAAEAEATGQEPVTAPEPAKPKRGRKAVVATEVDTA
jgi:hypothetical protein